MTDLFLFSTSGWTIPATTNAGTGSLSNEPRKEKTMSYDASEYAKSLRDLADWVEAHPEVQLPDESITIYAKDTKEEAAKVLRALMPCKKDYSDEIFTLSRSFGHISLKFMFLRKAVCTQRVVGTRVVPEQIIKGTPSEVIPEHEADIIEWDCDPILSESAEGEK